MGKWNFLTFSTKRFVMYFKKNERSSPKKLFYTLNKTPLGETGCLSNLCYLLAAQVSRFLITPLSRTQSVRPHLVASTSPCSPSVICGKPCYVIRHQVLPIQPFPGKQRTSIGMASILIICLCSHS